MNLCNGNAYINIYLRRECRKTSSDRRKFNFTGGFLIFLFMVTGRGIFICSTVIYCRCEIYIYILLVCNKWGEEELAKFWRTNEPWAGLKRASYISFYRPLIVTDL